MIQRKVESFWTKVCGGSLVRLRLLKLTLALCWTTQRFTVIVPVRSCSQNFHRFRLDVTFHGSRFGEDYAEPGASRVQQRQNPQCFGRTWKTWRLKSRHWKRMKEKEDSRNLKRQSDWKTFLVEGDLPERFRVNCRFIVGWRAARDPHGLEYSTVRTLCWLFWMFTCPNSCFNVTVSFRKGWAEKNKPTPSTGSLRSVSSWTQDFAT